MTKPTGLPLRSGLLKATIALLGWFGLSAGIYALLTDAVIEGIIWIVLTIAFSMILLRGSVAAEQENRSIPSMFWIFMAIFVIVVGATKVYNAIITDVQQLGSILVPELFQAISAAVYVVLLAIFLWQLLKNYQQRQVA